MILSILEKGLCTVLDFLSTLDEYQMIDGIHLVLETKYGDYLYCTGALLSQIPKCCILKL